MPTDPNLELIYRLSTDPALSYGVQAHMEAMGKQGDQVLYRLAQYDPEAHKNGNGNGNHLFIDGETLSGMKFPDTVWAIPGFIPAGLTIFAGKAKLGKSWMMMQAACAVAAGGVFMDRRVEPALVGYFALEDNERRIVERMNKQNWPTEARRNVKYIFLRRFQEEFGLIRHNSLEKLAEHIKQNNFKLVVIDTLSRALGGDQNDMQEMTNVLSPLQLLAVENNVAVVLIDHHKKGSTEFSGADAIGDILGSTGKGAVADTAIGLYRERNRENAQLSITGRDVEETVYDVYFDKRFYCWQLDIGGTFGMSAEEKDIINALENLGKPSTQSEILSELGRGHESKDYNWIGRKIGSIKRIHGFKDDRNRDVYDLLTPDGLKKGVSE